MTSPADTTIPALDQFFNGIGREKERIADAVRTLGGITVDAVEELLTETLALQKYYQDQMDGLVNAKPAAVNTPGTINHGNYQRAMAARDALTAPILALQALVNAARRY